MTQQHARTAVLLLSHVLNRHVLALFDEIERECTPAYDVTLLADNTKGIFDAFRQDRRFYLFDLHRLQSLGYPGKSAIVYQQTGRKANPYHKNFNFVPGSTDLPVLYWWREHLDYDHIWIVEYDVRYTGSWRRFFDGFADNDADLLGTTLTRYRDEPGWYHWPSINLLEDPPDRDTCIRGFFPVYRISHPALTHLDGEYRRGIGGHYEGVLPTVLHRAGLRIEDTGGDGEFVRPENKNRHYRNTPGQPLLSPGTFVFRPIMTTPGSEPDKLWHPVKPATSWRTALRRLLAHLRG